MDGAWCGGRNQFPRYTSDWPHLPFYLREPSSPSFTPEKKLNAMSRMRRYSTSTVSSSDTTSSYSDGEDDDNDDVITIDLDSTKLTQSILAARRTATSEFQETLQEDCQELHIIASVASDIPDKTSRLSVKIVTGVPDEKDSDTDSGAMQHWLLVTNPPTSFMLTFKKDILRPSVHHSRRFELVAAEEVQVDTVSQTY